MLLFLVGAFQLKGAVHTTAATAHFHGGELEGAMPAGDPGVKRAGPHTRGAEGWSGRAVLGIGHVLYVGWAADTSPHLHHAIQICVALDGRFRLRLGSAGAWRRRSGAIVRSNQLHQFDASGVRVLILFLEPESESGRRLVVGDPSLPLQEIRPTAVQAIRGAVKREGELGGESAGRLRQEVLGGLGLRVELRERLDPRVRASIRRIRGEPARRWAVAELARAAELSPRRFRELFSSQIGMSCRQYLLWSRLRAAVAELVEGVGLTEAALDAGFSDAAHLTRSFRRMVGIAPSAVARSVTLIAEPG
jgi:AraC-like DNA-binding protein